MHFHKAVGTGLISRSAYYYYAWRQDFHLDMLKCYKKYSLYPLPSSVKLDKM